MKVNTLHISDEEYKKIVDKITAKSIEDLLRPIESEFEPGVAVSTDRIDYLLKKLRKAIRIRLIHIIKVKKLVRPVSRWKQREDNPSLYRLVDDLDIDNIDIPRALINVDQLIPDLRQRLIDGIDAIIKEIINHSLGND